MATYKLIQNIEAEDKILGPLSLRQFIFGLVTGFLLYICFILVTKGLYFMLILFLPPALFFGFFAFPFGKDQPTELWALGKINFYFKPRRRVWNQSGVKELVTVTVPRRVEHVYTDGLSQIEVHSRLQALANTIDSRGWAVKDVEPGVYVPPHMAGGSSDRLVDIGNLPQEVPSYDVMASDDVLDETANPLARQFDTMIDRSAQERRQQIIDQMNGLPPPVVTAQQATGGGEPWFIAPPVPVDPHAPSDTANERAAEEALAAELKSRAVPSHVSYGNLRTLWPLGQQPPAAAKPDPVAIDDTRDGETANADSAVSSDIGQAMTPPNDPAILALANNNDLNVATLAREAEKARQVNQSEDEVVISLH